MEFENLLTLIKTVSDSDLTDFDYEENGTRIRLKKKKETVEMFFKSGKDTPVFKICCTACCPASLYKRLQ